MADDSVLSVKVNGLDRVLAAVNRMPAEIQHEMTPAGKEAANVILSVEGLRKYPPLTQANQPPTPYYIRGRGTQTKSGNKGNSERYGTQFTVEQAGPLSTVIGNRASYARYLGGDEQARHMAAIGWRKLFDVAKEKLPEIQKIYQKYINRAIKKLGL